MVFVKTPRSLNVNVLRTVNFLHVYKQGSFPSFILLNVSIDMYYHDASSFENIPLSIAVCDNELCLRQIYLTFKMVLFITLLSLLIVANGINCS